MALTNYCEIVGEAGPACLYSWKITVIIIKTSRLIKDLYSMLYVIRNIYLKR